MDRPTLTSDLWPPPSLVRCPICKREFDPATSPAVPFCSERCRTIDLGRWLDESYGLPVTPDPEADEVPEPEAESNGNGSLPHST